ncbi:MAG: tyrosine-type recombinase/integrase [Gemmatimonadota bacterium]|nr:tyrosine-type recombinase/integrase [Gemmatimonadota bacterium]
MADSSAKHIRRRGRITEALPGVWRVRVYFGRGSDGRALFKHKTVRGTKRDADRVLTLLLKQKDEMRDRGDIPVRDHRTVEEWIEECLDKYCQRASPRTREHYRVTLRRYLKPFPELRAKKLTALNEVDVQGWLNRLGEGDLSTRTVAQVRGYFRICLRKAKHMRLIRDNPMEGSELPRPQHREMKCLSAEQAAKFLAGWEEDAKQAANAVEVAAASGGRTDLLFEQRHFRAVLYALFTVMIDTGLRPGEAAGLKWSDLEGSHLRVRRAWKQLGEGKWGLGPTKTGKPRSIPLGKRTQLALARLKQERNTWRVYAEGIFHDEDFIFTSAVGTPVDFQNIRSQHFKPMLKRLQLPDIRLYDLRHTAATILMGEKVNPKVVQERLGHSSITLTLDTYSHVLEGMQEEATAAMDAALSRGAARIG